MLDREAQLDLLMEHYRRPCCRERIPDADAVAPGGNPGCGDVVTVYLKVAPGLPERVERVGFLGSGCTISQAAASMLLESVQADRPTLGEILAMDHEDMIDMLGLETVSSRPRCATLALGTLKAAVRRYQRNQQRQAAGLPAEELWSTPPAEPLENAEYP